MGYTLYIGFLYQQFKVIQRKNDPFRLIFKPVRILSSKGDKMPLLYKRQIVLLLILCFSSSSTSAQKSYCQQIYNGNNMIYDKHYEQLCKSILRSSDINDSNSPKIRQMMAQQLSLLERVKNLENVYSKLKTLVDALKKILDNIGKYIGLPTPIEPVTPVIIDPNLQDYHHISGIVMKPGSVAFTVRTGDGGSFDKHDVDELEMDVYYNKNLFVIDKIIGKGIEGKDYTKLTLPLDTRSSRDRIKIPLSDVLVNETSFYIFLAPLNRDTIQIGDKTKIYLRYYKRVEPDELAPLIYQHKGGGADTIEVIAKSPV